MVDVTQAETATAASRYLVAAGRMVRRHQNQLRPNQFRLPPPAEGRENPDDRNIRREHPKTDRSDHREAKKKWHKDRNHVQPALST